MDFAELNVRLNSFSRQLPRAQSAFTATLVEAVAREEGLATPVDKGVARSNWQVGIGRDPTNRIPAHSPGRHLGRSETANQQIMLAEAQLALRRARADGEVNLVNNIPYMYDLNELGTSAQSPVGFVEQALELGLRAGSPEAYAAAYRVLGGSP